MSPRALPIVPASAAGAALAIAVTGAIDSLTPAQEEMLFARGRATDPAVAAAVAEVVAAVRARGDAALREQAQRFDGVALEAVEVAPAVVAAALRALPGELRGALEQAAAAIATFHRVQLPPPLEVEVRPGLRLGRRTEPLGRVGVYAPGGRAAYPSSVLMGVIPARVAGVAEVVVCSPPGRDGAPPVTVLAACALAGADRVFALGGAGAVAAMAFGTASVPAVDKVVGPGNAYVTEAKRQLAGVVASDCPAGPSEVLVVADATAPARLVAAELVAQAEHDPDAAAVLVSTDTGLLARVEAVLAEILSAQARAAIVRQSLAARGALLAAPSLAAALAFACRYAPEHLVLMVAEPRAALAGVRRAGTVFLGAASSVAFGDYLTGANHVLPTAGWGRAYGGLGTSDFLREMTWQELSPLAAAELAAATEILATAEGLPGHALAARLRREIEAATPGAGMGGGGLAEGGRGTRRPPSPAAAAPPSRPDRDAGLRGIPAVAERGARAPLPSAASPGPSGPRARPCLDEVVPYRGSEGAGSELNLSDNTNVFGMPPAAGRVLATVSPPLVTRYPTPYADALRCALADRHGVTPENVVTGCGSDDLLDAILRAYSAPGEAVALPVPTFGIVPAFVRVSGAAPQPVPLTSELALDVDGLLATGAALTYLCRPNNPTGTLFARRDVERLAAGMQGLLLLDEAYADFAGEDLAAWGVASRNVVTLRTLSKAHGLAGLRVGYALGPAELIAAVEKARGPFKVGGVAEAAALAVLREDGDWVRERVADACAQRDWLAGELRARGLDVLTSAANFVFARVASGAPDGGAVALAARLRQRGVGVRPFSALPVVGDGIRVTAGPRPLLEGFLAALDAVGPANLAAPAGEGRA